MKIKPLWQNDKSAIGDFFATIFYLNLLKISNKKYRRVKTGGICIICFLFAFYILLAL